MAALIRALDNHTPLICGEKGHMEYGWSSSTIEKIVQLNFQLSRTDSVGVERLKNSITSILSELKQKMSTCALEERSLIKQHLSLLYRMIGQTRDIIDGKGEYMLTYMMIRTWHDFYPNLALYAVKCIVDLEPEHPYGSWKDIKYLCEYCRRCGDDESHPIIQYSIKLINDQILKDYHVLCNMSTTEHRESVSLAAKWVPREKSAFGWLYQALATNYFRKYISSAKKEENMFLAILKCKTEYRVIISKLNRYIDTVQIKQCDKKWRQINFNKVSSITMFKQKKAFLNIKKNGENRYPDDNDRIACAVNFNQHIQKAVNGEIEIKGRRVGMVDFVKQALELCKRSSSGNSNSTTMEIELLNSQWHDNSKQTCCLGNVIPMVDVSSSMNGDPMYAAIALGIRIAEKSALGKRIMTFSLNPSWVNLDKQAGFVSQVEALSRAEWGMNTNFFKALDLILDAIIQNKMEAIDVQDMILVILSDMQIDEADPSSDTEVMYEKIKDKYANAGVRVHGVPYKPPHILFWNLRSTNGFPSLSTQKNASMMSGFSPALLNAFCDQGLSALEAHTPLSVLEKELGNDRYVILAKKLEEEIY
jgi:Domain of unknown function (DUF2828)